MSKKREKEDKQAAAAKPSAETNCVASFNFGLAMSIVLSGGRVRRADWRRPAYIELLTFGGNITAVCVIMRDDTMNTYTPSQCDMLGNDWYKI